MAWNLTVHEHEHVLWRVQHFLSRITLKTLWYKTHNVDWGKLNLVPPPDKRAELLVCAHSMSNAELAADICKYAAKHMTSTDMYVYLDYDCTIRFARTLLLNHHGDVIPEGRTTGMHEWVSDMNGIQVCPADTVRVVGDAQDRRHDRYWRVMRGTLEGELSSSGALLYLVSPTEADLLHGSKDAIKTRLIHTSLAFEVVDGESIFVPASAYDGQTFSTTLIDWHERPRGREYFGVY